MAESGFTGFEGLNRSLSLAGTRAAPSFRSFVFSRPEFCHVSVSGVESFSGEGSWVPCEDRVLDGPTYGGKGSKGGPYQYCNPRT